MRIKLLFVALVLVCASCANRKNTSGQTVTFEEADSDTAFKNLVSHIELTRLNEDSYLMGSELSMIPCSGGVVLVDKRNTKVARFSEQGEFQNEIGKKGNGPGEYVHLLGVQVDADVVTVFAAPDKIMEYDLEGNLLTDRSCKGLGLSAYKSSTGLYTYYGYSGVEPYRVAYFPEDGEKQSYLPVETKLLPLSLGNDIFSHSDDVYMLDSYSNTVYKLSEEGCKEHVSFDFGDYAIGDEFYSFNDAFKSAEYLMSSDNALIYRYVPGLEHSIVQVNLKSSSSPASKVVYGISDSKGWKWFALDADKEMKSVCGPFRYFKDNVLYAILEPGQVTKFVEEFKEKVVEGQTDEEDSHYIAKIWLD